MFRAQAIFDLLHHLLPVLQERIRCFDIAPAKALRQQQEAKATGTARQALADPDAYDLNALNAPQRKALIRF